MKKRVNLAMLKKEREKCNLSELSKKEMKNSTAGETDETYCCHMFCTVTGDSTGELIFFITQPDN